MTHGLPCVLHAVANVLGGIACPVRDLWPVVYHLAHAVCDADANAHCGKGDWTAGKADRSRQRQRTFCRRGSRDEPAHVRAHMLGNRPGALVLVSKDVISGLPESKHSANDRDFLGNRAKLSTELGVGIHIGFEQTPNLCAAQASGQTYYRS